MMCVSVAQAMSGLNYPFSVGFDSYLCHVCLFCLVVMGGYSLVIFKALDHLGSFLGLDLVPLIILPISGYSTVCTMSYHLCMYILLLLKKKE
jgi:hypothetical protein